MSMKRAMKKKNGVLNFFGAVRKDTRKLQKELEETRGKSLRTGSTAREPRIMSRHDETLTREEIMEK